MTQSIGQPNSTAPIFPAAILSSADEVIASVRHRQAVRMLAPVAPKKIEKAERAIRPDLPPPPPFIAAMPEDFNLDWRDPTLDCIIKRVCKLFSVSRNELESPRRSRTIVLPRQMVYALAKKHTKLTYPQIGKMMAGRDHTTVLHGVKTWQAKKERVRRARSDISDGTPLKNKPRPFTLIRIGSSRRSQNGSESL